jgi:hypothetical protein
VIFLLEGAKDLHERVPACLFPEILKSELREVRATIEAYSRSSSLEGASEASACGRMLAEGQPWNATLRVYADGMTTEYRLDRWD